MTTLLPTITHSKMRNLIKDAAYHLDDEVLAVHLQLIVMSIARYLVFAYVAGQMVAEAVHPYLVLMGESFSYRYTQTGDDTSIQLNHTN